MNIFVTDDCPIQSARNLPDKHIVKMPLETCQMLSIIYSDWYYGVGKLYKSDGTPYRTQHGAFRNHPCTQWAADNQYNLAWLIAHGIALCHEYTARYHKRHTCHDVIRQALVIYTRCFSHWPSSQAYRKVTSFTRAMPDYLKSDFTITTITAYQRYLNTKPWLATNYLRIPSRKPYFIKSMTQITPDTASDTDFALPVYDFSNEPSQVDVEMAKSAAKKAIKDALPSEGLVPAPKAAKTSPAKKSGKAGRIVGISKDENEYIQQVLQMIADDSELGSSNPNYAKIQARYNK